MTIRETFEFILISRIFININRILLRGKMIEKQKIAYCGLNCAECLIFIATVNDDYLLRQKIAQEWSGLYGEYLNEQGIHGFKPEEMSCRGCQSDNGRFLGCAVCVIRKCCQEKKLESCAYCREYEKCEVLNGFYSFQEHKPAKDNLDKIRSGF